MKQTYEKRWGHARFKKATIHLEVKAQKRREAEARNSKYQALSYVDKCKWILCMPGNHAKQSAKLVK